MIERHDSVYEAAQIVTVSSIVWANWRTSGIPGMALEGAACSSYIEIRCQNTGYDRQESCVMLNVLMLAIAHRSLLHLSE